MVSPGCIVARMTGVAMGGAVLLGSMVLALVFPRRVGLGWSCLLVLVVMIAAAGAVLLASGHRDRVWVDAGEIALTALLAAVLVPPAAEALGRARWAESRALAAALWRSASWVLLLCGVALLTVFWDALNYWDKTDQVAGLVRAGLGLDGVVRLLRTATDEYSMIPALLPGLLTSPLPPDSVLGYSIAVAVGYVFPATVAAGLLGLHLVRGLRAEGDPFAGRSTVDLVVLGGVAGFGLLPMFLQAFLKDGYLDIGGVPIMILLACAWQYGITVLTRPPALGLTEQRALQLLGAGVCVALLSIFGFVFRRWYVFDVLGFGAAAALYAAVAVARSGRPPAVLAREAGIFCAGALLAGVSAGAPIIINWAATWQRRQYAEAYAAYWLGWEHELGKAFDAFGIVIPAGCVLLLFVFLLRGKERALPFILLLGTALALLGFFRVEGMGYQHYYVVMPLLSGAAAAGAILFALRFGVLKAAGLLLVLTLAIVAAPRQDHALALALPRSVDLRPQVDPAVPELVQLGAWLDANLGPRDGYCVLASSLHMNGSLVSQVWQVDPALIHSPVRTNLLWLGEVDTWQGPPDVKLRACKIVVTASPPQTHLQPADQQSILLPLHDLLTGTGIGAAFAEDPARFVLPAGIEVRAYRMQRPVTDAEFADLRRRFFEGKGAEADRYRARFRNPKLDQTP